MTSPSPIRDFEQALRSYHSTVPQRYVVNRGRYETRGGLIRLEEDTRGFLATENNKDDMARFYFFCLVLDFIAREGLGGEFAELGVYKGHTASLLAAMARRLGKNVYLFDTFSGFSDADLKGIDSGIPVGFEDTSVEAVRALVGNENVQFVPGYFPSSATQLPKDVSFSLVHLDCDLYAPMSSALEYFYARLVPGGFLIVHDYSSLHWAGVERAVDEFFATKAEMVIPVPDSAGSIVVRKTSTRSRYDNWYVQRNAGLLQSQWTSAAEGKLSALLGDGWRNPEKWGVWGLNEVHQFFVFLAAPPTDDIELEFDVFCKLHREEALRKVAVFAEKTKVKDWEFTVANNRSVRSVRIPRRCIPSEDNSLPVVRLTFQHVTVSAKSEENSPDKDRRRVGIALHRVRRIT